MPVTPPTVGTPTRQELIQAIIDELDLLNAQTGVPGTFDLPNGSFEAGTDPDTAPDGWELTAAAGNTTAFETSASKIRHGLQSFSMTTPGGVTGGAILQMTDALPCAEGVVFNLRWEMKSTQVDIANAVKVIWYNASGTVVATDTLYSEAAANSLTFTVITKPCLPPAGAVTYKVQITGVNNTNDGTVYWDGFEVIPPDGEVGDIKASATATPDGPWLACDGSAVSRTTYARLFAAIGTTWGIGNGSSTFNLPDLQGRTVIGSGAGSGLTSRAIADSGGEETHVLTTPEIPSHSHVERVNTGSGGTTGVQVNTTGSGTGATSISTDATGGGGAHNTMPPFKAAPYFIRY